LPIKKEIELNPSNNYFEDFSIVDLVRESVEYKIMGGIFDSTSNKPLDQAHVLITILEPKGLPVRNLTTTSSGGFLE